MKHQTIALFGESEKGELHTAYFCQSLADLVDYLGQPPAQSQGLHYAVQALLFESSLIFFRVREEGFSRQDYLAGLHLLEHQTTIHHLAALLLPGVGDAKIIDASLPLCLMHHSILITTEADFYDYLTSQQESFNGQDGEISF